uniref:Histidine-containing phosphotransfer protein n=1 Tax=Kalanchoe fedtschenkoi TaxID=63787 RepID=A0A7N0UUA7_KALFE
MASNGVIEQVFEARKALFDEGLLDEHFEELESVEGPDDATFMEDLVNSFLKDMKHLINLVGQELDQATPDTQALDQLLHQIKGNTASVGAKQLSIICNQMRGHVLNGEIERCKEAQVQLETQRELLDQRFGVYFELRRELLPGIVTDGSPSPRSEVDDAEIDDVKGKEI